MNIHLDMPSGLPAWQVALLLAPPLAAACAALFAVSGAASASVWRAARFAATAALAFAALSLACVLLGSTGSSLGMRADPAGGVMLLLVSFVGWIIVRYSQPYLSGERDQHQYVCWLMVTLATVSLVVVANHLLVLVFAWSATSLALHRLLTFFSDRPAAVVTAHKKFIVGRAADLCMLVAAALLFHAFDTMQIDQIALQAAALAQLPGAAQAAVVLLACAALLKCAQLPFHGWLIQVMEAPTPVSALLHAGVVNLGGFVLIRFAPLIAEVPAAQVLLVAAGTSTAVLAALVMTTRISIKVMLAWSTCAQMGFMLMQCGLGAWDMALLHLVAHSLYKAHAFLAAGGTVRRASIAQLAAPAALPGPLGLALGAVLGIGMTLLAGAAWRELVPAQAAPPAIWVLAGIVAFAVVPLLHAQSLRLRLPWLAALGLGSFAVPFAYFGLHALFGTWLAPSAAATPAPLWIAVALAFAALFLVQSLIMTAPHASVARALYPWFYGGLFIDEKFNRIAFGLWPPPQPAVAAAALLPAPDPVDLDTRHAAAGVRP